MAYDRQTQPVAYERCLDAYFREINRYPLLSQEQEVDVARRARGGDEAALRTLVRSNLRFVVSVAKQYAGRGILLSDLINEGNLGMMKAAERFDVERGFRFISYAVWWIRQSIIQALKDKSRMVRLPQSQTALLSRITQAREHLRNAGVMNPHSERVAEQLGIPVEKVRVVTQANRAVLDLESHGETGNQLSLADTLVAKNQPLPDDRLTRESLSIDLESLLTKLTEREAEVIRRYYGLGREEAQTLQQIGDEIGVTRERIRQIKEKALEQMRRSPYPDRINGRPQPG